MLRACCWQITQNFSKAGNWIQLQTARSYWNQRQKATMGKVVVWKKAQWQSKWSKKRKIPRAVGGEWFERKPNPGEEKKEEWHKWLGQMECSEGITCFGATKSQGQGQEKFRQSNSDRSEKSRMAYCEAHWGTDRWQWDRMDLYRQENLQWLGRKPASACRQWYICHRKPGRWQIGFWWLGTKPVRKSMMWWVACKKAIAESLGKVSFVCMHFWLCMHFVEKLR